MLLLHRGIQAIKIREPGDITLNRGDVLPDLSYGGIQFALPATGNVDIRAFGDEAPGRGQADAAAATRDDSDFSFKFGQDVSPPMESIS
jgi:hypothetical protein